MASSEKTILLEKRDQIAYITFNRPEKLNAMRAVEYKLLNSIVNDCDRDAKIRVMIITGKGRAFSAGDDMAWWAGGLEGLAESNLPGVNITQVPNLKLMESEKVVIAAVNGICWLPGLVLAADFVIAADVATFAEGDIRAGICSGSGETQLLTRILGRRRALEFILMDEPISAQEAYRIGLVNKVVPLEQLMPEAEALARKMIAYPASGIKYTKLAITHGQDLPIREALALENRYSGQSMAGGTLQKFGKEFLDQKSKGK